MSRPGNSRRSTGRSKPISIDCSICGTVPYYGLLPSSASVVNCRSIQEATSMLFRTSIFAFFMALCALLARSGASETKADESYYLQKGDVVLFLGDSITEETKY